MENKISQIDLYQKNGYNYSFNQNACNECGGRCCIGESGYIKATIHECEQIADFIGLTLENFAAKYLIKLGYSFSLTEKKYLDGFACIFFDTEVKQCGIYEVRPKQCRDFPFWEVFKNNEQEVRKECPGIY